MLLDRVERDIKRAVSVDAGVSLPSMDFIDQLRKLEELRDALERRDRGGITELAVQRLERGGYDPYALDLVEYLKGTREGVRAVLWRDRSFKLDRFGQVDRGIF